MFFNRRLCLCHRMPGMPSISSEVQTRRFNSRLESAGAMILLRQDPDEEDDEEDEEDDGGGGSQEDEDDTDAYDGYSE